MLKVFRDQIRLGNASFSARVCPRPPLTDLRSISSMASLTPYVLSGYKPCGLPPFTDPF